MLVAGLSIVVLRPMFMADEMATSVYERDTGLVWFGWLLLVFGAGMMVFSVVRSRRKKRS